MPTILEEIQARVAQAQQVLTEATQRFQVAQQALQKAQSDFNVWNAALGIETREEQLRTATAKENQLPMNLSQSTSEPDDSISSAPAPESVNQTEVVRELLRQHPTGMTPTEIWKEVSGQFKYRAYLYSVLKRLRDRDEVVMRRKKYALRPQQEAPQPIIIQ